MAVAGEGKAEFPADFSLPLLDHVVLELHDGAAGVADEVVVVVMPEGELVRGPGVAERGLDHEVRLREKLQGAVDGGAGDGNIFSPELHEEAVGVEVVVDAVDSFDQDAPRHRHPEPLAAQVGLEGLQALLERGRGGLPAVCGFPRHSALVPFLAIATQSQYTIARLGRAVKLFLGEFWREGRGGVSEWQMTDDR